MFTTNRTALGFALVAGFAVSGCGAAQPDSTETTGTLAAAEGAIVVPGEVPGLAPGGIDHNSIPGLDPATLTMHTFIPQSLEIEQFALTARVPADANLVSGPDPVDGSASVHAPTGGTPLFVDWNDLGGAIGQHRYVDASVLSGGRTVDHDTFGTGGEACIGTRTIPGSFDLSYVAIANNLKFAYLAALRADHAVDADVVFLFTQKRPEVLGWTLCGAAPKTLRFSLTEGADVGDADVLIAGHFVANAEPLFRAYVVGRPATHVSPAAALDVREHWVERAAVAAAAGNVTRTATGSFGAPGVKATAGDATSIDAGMFVELAIPMTLFAPQADGGRTRYLTVMTLDRYSAGGATLVDLAGPIVVDMAPPKIAFPEPPLPQPWLPPEDPAWSLPGVE